MYKRQLSGRLSHKPYELSGGQQQRVAIARAIAADPDLILADEPCGNLDSRSGKEVMELLLSRHKCGKTVILITHSLSDAKYADRILTCLLYTSFGSYDNKIRKDLIAFFLHKL